MQRWIMQPGCGIAGCSPRAFPNYTLLISLGQTLEESNTAWLALPQFLHWDGEFFKILQESLPRALIQYLRLRKYNFGKGLAFDHQQLLSPASHWWSVVEEEKPSLFLLTKPTHMLHKRIAVYSNKSLGWGDILKQCWWVLWLLSFSKAGTFHWQRKAWCLGPNTFKGKCLCPVQASYPRYSIYLWM